MKIDIDNQDGKHDDARVRQAPVRQAKKENMKSHKLKLVEGNEATKIRIYEYRGGTIKSRVRSHDYRNKSHPGYEWDYSLPGGFVGSTHKRSIAVFFIDFEIAKRENNTVELDRLKAIIRMGKL